MATRRLKIRDRILEGHEATPAEWAAAKPALLEGHEGKPERPLVVSLRGKGKVEVRLDNQGNLLLEFKDE
jgi:hypothetical protein